MTTEPSQGDQRSGGIGFGWKVYQQVASIIGAFAILAFLTNLAHFDLRGLVATLVKTWDQVVRPPTRWVLHYLTEVPLAWVGWHVEVPQWLHDYLAAGFVLIASFLRLFRQLWRGGFPASLGEDEGDPKLRAEIHEAEHDRLRRLRQVRGWRGFATMTKTALLLATTSWVGLVFLGLALAWPLVVLTALYGVVVGLLRVSLHWRERSPSDATVIGWLIVIISPLIYAGVLLAANYLILR